MFSLVYCLAYAAYLVYKTTFISKLPFNDAQDCLLNKHTQITIYFYNVYEKELEFCKIKTCVIQDEQEIWTKTYLQC